MMHIKNDRWYLAQHPLHFTGDPATMTGGDNAGVGSGLAFAEALVAREPAAMVGLIPCAVGGSPIRAWQKSEGRSLYDRAIQRAKLTLEKGPPGRTRICGALWLQGESDSTEELLPRYQDQLLKLVDNLRADLQQPDLPFIACTIGSFIGQRPKQQFPKWTRWTDINEVLLALPGQRPRTACVDARDLKTGHIGDFTHYDTPSQLIIGQRFADKYFQITAAKEPQQ